MGTDIAQEYVFEEASDDTTTTYAQNVQCFDLHKVPSDLDVNWMRTVAESDGMWVHAKAYVSGGENTLHRHLEEDHLFFVVSGTVTFTLQDDVTVEMGAMQFIPGSHKRGLVAAHDDSGIGTANETATPRI